MKGCVFHRIIMLAKFLSEFFSGLSDGSLYLYYMTDCRYTQICITSAPQMPSFISITKIGYSCPWSISFSSQIAGSSGPPPMRSVIRILHPFPSLPSPPIFINSSPVPVPVLPMHWQARENHMSWSHSLPLKFSYILCFSVNISYSNSGHVLESFFLQVHSQKLMRKSNASATYSFFISQI